MKTKLLLLLFLVNFSIYAQHTLIPDLNFEKKLIALGIDSGAPDGKVLNSKISSLETIDLQFSSISDLTGIEGFTSLKTLNCYSNNLKSLDLSQNVLLENLRCESNQITQLIINKNTNLKSLECGSNLLTSLNVSNNKKLLYISCYQNQLTTIDISNNTALTELYASKNKLFSLDLSHNPLLNYLYCEENFIQNLDVSQNPDLIILYCHKNQISSLDLSANKKLTVPLCNYNNLTSLNLKNGNNASFHTSMNFSNNPNLTCIQVDDVVYSNTNWQTKKDSQATYSTNCGPTYTLIPDIKFEEKLIALGIDTGTVDGKVLISNIASVKTLDITNSKIKDLTGIEAFTNLEVLYCAYNELTTLDFSNNLKLRQLECYENKLTNLNVSKNTALWYLDCFTNQLSALDLSQNKLLTTVYCYDNLLVSLNVTGLTALKSLDCPDNKLSYLDVSSNTGLQSLHCYSNKLSSLDLSKNSVLNDLICHSNNLNSLNLKNGNNKNFIVSNYTKFTNNPNLTCIEVDDVTYSNTNWSGIKDLTASYSNSCAPLYTLIPDLNFEKKLIDLGIDTGVSDGRVLTSKISNLQSLNVAKSNISDLTGIQDFKNLTSLDISSNSLKKVNLTQNIALTELDCSINKLDSLKVDQNILLKKLLVHNNNLKEINTSKNLFLEIAHLGFNKLTHLEVSKNINLTQLTFESNLLKAIDVSKNTALIYFICNSNQLTSIDVSKNTALKYFICDMNNLNYLNLKNGNNTLLDNIINLKNNPNLLCIQVDDVAYANKNWINKDLSANFNTDCPQYSLIPDSNFEQKLIDLGIDTDGLNGKITIADASSITTLDLSNSNIKDLTGIENFTALSYLDCSNNQITSLDLSQNVFLETLNVSSNQITSLDLSKNSKLTVVYALSNPLEFLNLQNGNNKNIIIASQTGKTAANTLATTFLGLNKLGCVKVDDVVFSNANWSKIKESTTTYSSTCSLSIEDSAFNKVVMYPNPTKGEININNVSLDKTTVYNSLGQLVKSFTLNSTNTDNTINLSGLPKGVYYIYLINGDNASVKKVIVE